MSTPVAHTSQAHLNVRLLLCQFNVISSRKMIKKKTEFYTGLPSWAVFLQVLSLLTAYLPIQKRCQNTFYTQSFTLYCVDEATTQPDA